LESVGSGKAVKGEAKAMRKIEDSLDIAEDE
jgi:hypothetical protein